VLADVRERETVLADFNTRDEAPAAGRCMVQRLD
jgi:hypothetical protein